MTHACCVCPRHCNVVRSVAVGYCNCGNDAVVAKTMLHMWEEPPISGTRGSGAVFFTGCSLRCCYCQNYLISQNTVGRTVSAYGLADIFHQLVDDGAHNINLVTPTHFTPQILAALKIYHPPVPVIWNTSSYESAENIKRISDAVDVYLADLKYFSPTLSAMYSNAPDYFKYASLALLEMRKNQPLDVFDTDGMMTSGLIVRHLVLPGAYNDSRAILDWIAERLGTATYISLMNQYTPCHKALTDPVLGRKLKPAEYKLVTAHLESLGFENGFLQGADSQTCAFTPDFTKPS